MEATREISLRLTDGSTLVVPATLSSATTYTILEQERWFEKELDFLLAWLSRGMTAIDVGANLGVYSLPIARRVGEEGKVYAYEPASVPRRFLERSRDANRPINLEIRGEALSDAPRQGRLLLGSSSELNRLAGSADGGSAGESVEVTSLDAEDALHGWPAPDFVKLDAEGEENRIVEGGRDFLARYSPLVLFEVRQGASVNHDLIATFRRLGYGIFRALPGMPLLVPFAATEEIDGYELNLFAAKPDRAATIAREGLLLEAVPSWRTDDRALASAFDAIRAQTFASTFAPLFARPVDSTYRDALSAYSAWRDTERALPERCAALRHSCDVLLKLCERAPSPARLSSLARFGWEAGRRSVTVVALQVFAANISRGLKLDEPFWPASPRFDALSSGSNANEWFLASALELLERSKNLSSFYGASGVDLEWLCRGPYPSVEIERRRVLQAWRAGVPMPVPERLRNPAPSHVNAGLWRSGSVQDALMP